jgi:hypothetical protein
MNSRIIVGIVVLVASIFGFTQPKAEVKDVEAIGYFSSSYKEAREKFLEAAQVVGASVESFKHPDAGPEGEMLFTDVAMIGPKDAKVVLVLISGTHGAEGFAGSAIQTGLLRQGTISHLKPDTSILMIHALNPYGFAHLRRFNEDNVDLNRNFLDHSEPYPKNPGYEELADIIAPKSIDFWSETAFWSGIAWYWMWNGYDKLREVISRGQYSHPEGLFYGGRFETWSNKMIRSIAQRYISGADRVVAIDIHTGLGPYGKAEIIVQDIDLKEMPIYKRAVAMWGTGRVRSQDESVSNKLEGSLKVAFPEMLPNAEVTAVTLEYGTSPTIEVFLAMREENWIHHHGDVHDSRAQGVKAKLRSVFYPDKEDWKETVWSQGKQIVDQALGGISSSTR